MDQNITRGQASIDLTASAYAGTLSVADTVYVDGGKYIIEPTSNSVEGATLNINGIGACDLVKLGRVKINRDDLTSGRMYEVIYDGTHTEFVVQGLPNSIRAYYIFAENGGAQGAISLTSAIPVGIELKINQALINIIEAPTSAGLAVIEFGNTGGVNTLTGMFDSERPFNDPSSYGRGIVYSSFQAANVPYGTFTITGGAGGTIDTVTVDGVNILNGTVAYSSSLTVTARHVAANINSNPNTTYRASSSGAVVYLYVTILNKFSFGSTNLPVIATATTMTVGTYQDVGFSGLSNNTGTWVPGYYITGGPLVINIKISGADLTAGILKLTVPYDVAQ